MYSHDERARTGPRTPADGALAGLAEHQAARAARQADAARRQRLRGRRSAWERVELLLDAGSFTELGSSVRHRSLAADLVGRHPLGDAVVTGHGTVQGRPVCCFAQDFSAFGGSLGEAVGRKIVNIMDLAMDSRAPVIGINDSAGGRIQEGVVAQSLYGQIFARNVRMSGVVPQISLITGPCAGGAAYSPALTDFVVMVERTSHMFVTGPELTRQAVGERVSLEELGGARMHNTRAGTAHYLAADEDDAFRYVRALLSYLPSGGEPSTALRPPSTADAEGTRDGELDALASPDGPHDSREVLSRVLDGGDFLEVQALYAPGVTVGFGRLGGAAVGVVASQRGVDGGRLDDPACDKAARFVRTCDAFGLPVLSFVDSRGAAPGAERGAARLLFAYAEATVPLLTVVTGTAEGLGYLALGSRQLGGDLSLAWPGARVDGHNAFHSAELGLVDEVVLPRHTRSHLHRALWLLRAKQQTRPPRKHDNLPL